jgi:hypothetical protein
MKRIVRLTESDLVKLVKKVLKEQTKPFDPKTFNPGKSLVKDIPQVSKKQYVQPTPKGQSIQPIQIKVGDKLVDLTMMKKTSRGASFYGKIRNYKQEYFYEYMEITFECGRSEVVMHTYDYHSNPNIDPDYNYPLQKISPQATKLLNKASGCDSYASNQDTSSDMV